MEKMLCRPKSAFASRLDGIIGYNYLKEFKTTIDYPNEILRLE
jgi:hypothetical protein